jgi:hypothetical protein
MILSPNRSHFGGSCADLAKAPPGELCMTKFRHLIWMMTAAFGLMLSAQQSYAK